MATVLDPAALERELETLRWQRLEASQRVRASRQPAVAPSPQARNAAGEPSGARPPLGSGRSFGPDRAFGAPRGDEPRAAAFRDGPLAGRLGPQSSSQRGAFGPSGGGPAGPARGRFDSQSGARGRGYSEHGRDWEGPRGDAAAAAAPPRRRAVQSLVVREKEPEQGADRDGERFPERERDREGDRDRGDDRSRDRWHGGEDQGRPWGRDNRRDDEAGDGRPGSSRHVDADELSERGGAGAWGRSGAKRPAPEPEPTPAGPPPTTAADPDSRKRARRLLGRALLGTLQKFRQEDAQFQASETAARRAELARKAEEKAATESERLRRQAAEERARKRQEELTALMDLNLATDIKVLELMYAKKLARRRVLSAFLRSNGLPASSAGAGAGGRGSGSSQGPSAQAAGHHAQPQPVYWMPARHNDATRAMKERQDKELRDWEEAVLGELELEKDGLRLRAQARRDGIAERRQRAAEARAAAGGGEGEGEEEAAEDHEALDAGELDAHPEDHTGAEAEAQPEPEPEIEVDVEVEHEHDLDMEGVEAGLEQGEGAEAKEGGDHASARNVGAEAGDVAAEEPKEAAAGGEVSCAGDKTVAGAAREDGDEMET